MSKRSYKDLNGGNKNRLNGKDLKVWVFTFCGEGERKEKIEIKNGRGRSPLSFFLGDHWA